MTKLESLINYFESFPGVGARQAKRFAFHVLRMETEQAIDFADAIATIQSSVRTCIDCHRFFSSEGSASKCSICANPNRDATKLLVVERDADIDPIERSEVYDGLYFVLGGTAPLLENQENNRLRSGKLKQLIEERITEDLNEVILGFSINPDGENTARFVRALIQSLNDTDDIAITYLGRGLSTGSELEYADPETVKNALNNRQ